MNKKGFTLMELLAVITVLAILGAITITSFSKVREKAADDTFNSLVKEIEDLGPSIYSHELLAGFKDYKEFCDYMGGTINPYNGSCRKQKNNVGILYDVLYDFNSAYKAGTPFIIKLKDLQAAGYMKKVNNPYGNDTCDGFLYIDPKSTSEKYKGYLKCGEHSTPDYDTTMNNITMNYKTVKLTPINK